MDRNAVEVLLVEDNPTDVELTLRALKEKGIRNEFVVARDGAEALDYLFATGAYAHRDMRHTPPLVLLDLRLPKVDGIEVLQRIKSDQRTKQIPVVVLTSSGQEPDIAKCYELGVNSYIVKPVDFDKFADMVSELGLYWLVLNETPR